jgi:hypothetical protein
VLTEAAEAALKASPSPSPAGRGIRKEVV